MLDSAHQRSATLEHVVFYGGPGLGRTTLAAIVAAEQNARFHERPLSMGGRAESPAVKVSAQRDQHRFLEWEWKGKRVGHFFNVIVQLPAGHPQRLQDSFGSA